MSGFTISNRSEPNNSPEPNDLGDTDDIFGESPNVEYTEPKSIFQAPLQRHAKPTDDKKGGTVHLKQHSTLYYFLIVVLVVGVIYLLYNIYWQYKAPTIHKDAVARHFNRIHGDAFDVEAKHVIEHGEQMESPGALDHYRVGTVYLVNARDPYHAYNHFRRALELIIEGETDARQADYIIDRIDDYKDHFIDHTDIEDLPLQQALLAQANNMRTLIQNVSQVMPEVKVDDPEFVQKTLLSRKQWVSDSQNVHDETIYKELNAQLQKVKAENTNIKNNKLHDYSEVRGWLLAYFADEPNNRTKINKVLRFLDQNNPVGTLPGVCEQDILVNAWRRAYDPGNKGNFSAIREAIADAVLDCVEGDKSVCMAGRTAKIWQALARLDKDPEIGILKSKQLVRNEIYEKCAKVVSDYIGETGSASDQLREAYNQSAQTEQVRELIECMHKDMDAVRAQYVGMLPTDQLDRIIAECKSVCR